VGDGEEIKDWENSSFERVGNCSDWIRIGLNVECAVNIRVRIRYFCSLIIFLN